jgi:rhodanese-related sulfurtransferase
LFVLRLRQIYFYEITLKHLIFDAHTVQVHFFRINTMLQFIKNLFGISSSDPSLETVQNDTSHPEPVYEQLPGNLFKQAYQQDKSAATLLDVRTTLEVRSGALPNAMHIDIMSSSFTKQVAVLDKSKTYYVYCKSGARSGQACKTMHKMGFDVRNLMGGIGAWPK